MKYFFITFYLFLCIAEISSQPYTIKKLGLEKGLSNNYINDIVEDKKGYLWFATEEGLNKLEGNHFTSFYKKSGKVLNLTGNELNCLLDDPTEPILWIGTQRSGLNAFNYQTNQQIIYQHDKKNPNSICTNDITGIYPTSDGNLWITTYWQGIDYLDKKTGKFTHYNQTTIPELPSNTVWTLLDDNKGNLYIGHHAENGMSILSLKTKKVKNFTHDPNNKKTLPHNNVQCIFKDNTGNIWAGTGRGLALFNPNTEEFIWLGEKNPSLSHLVYDIQQFNENQLWVATELGGIAIIDLSKTLFNTAEEIHVIQAGNNEHNLNNSTVRCLFQDSHQNIWAGTWGGGINFLSSDGALFKSFSYSPNSPESSLSTQIASAVCIDKQGLLWIGTDGGGINVLKDGQRIATYTEESGHLSGNSVQTALCDQKGNLWFGIFNGGIMYYNIQTKSFQQIFPEKESTQDVRSLFEDNNGTIWVGTSNGVFQIDRESKKILQHMNANAPDNLVRSVMKDKKGQIWVGSFGRGIFLYASNGKRLKEFNTYLNFPSNTINQIFEDSKGCIWAATGEGLVQIENSSPWKYKVYQRNEGLANTFIWAIEEDENQNIWFSTNQGISCFVRNEENIYNYDFRDNIPMASFTGRSVCKGKNGVMYFGSTNGLCYFTPSYILEKRQAPKAIIGKITVFEPLVSENSNETEISLINKESVRLKHLQNNFNISFSIQDYSLNERVEYAYMLKGLENSWYTVKDPNNVTFRNLPPGKYEFMIKTRIRNQEWSDEISSIEIIIAPPLWLSWWAKLLYVISGVGLLFTGLWAYKRKLNLEYLYESEKNTYPQALHGEDIHTEKQDAKAEDSTMKLEAIEPDKNARPIILVVEDNADIRDYIADSFTNLYEVKTAANGKEGLQIATDCIPDIIVSDIMMPVMNGVIMCQKLKADIRTSHIPVILLTAKDSITDKEEGYQAGADSYLTKPFSASLLQSRISNLLTQRRLLSERFAIRPDKPEKQSMEEKRAIITESMSKLDKEFLDKITNTITEGLAAAENIDITVLSNVMCMSSSTLYRKVKALTGMSTNEYIRKIKMQLAEKYLLEGKYSISEIAFKVGINSNVYFRQCFKEEFGMSASDYLKQLTGKSIDEKVDE